MNRRTFVSTAALSLSSLPFLGRADARVRNPKSPAEKGPETPWKEIEFTTQISTQGEGKPYELWLPLPLAQTSYQELLTTTWTGNFVKAGILKEKPYNASVFYARWENPAKIELAVTHRVRLRDRNQPEALAMNEDVALYLKPTDHIPIDGIVAETAQKIVKKTKNPDQKAKLIYEWMVENTARDAKVRGCGVGDVKALLTSNTLGGKCADLSSLYVGLCRAAGLPAREVFGLRVSASKVSKSLGKVGDVSKGQHCRAEYYSENRGWIPVDPADVRKVMLEENLPLTDKHVAEVRTKLFGAWEMNWVAYNSARDSALMPDGPTRLNYLMYPLLAVNGTIIDDGMDPDRFRYSIAAKELG